MIPQNLILMDAGMFCIDMHIKAPLYYLYKGAYVLLCKDIVFTEDLIEKLYNLACATDGIFVQSEDYEAVWDESLRQHALEAAVYERTFSKVRKNYDQILSKTVGLLNDISSKENVSLSLSSEITQSIMAELMNQDSALLLRCVNMLNAADSYLYTHCMNVATLNGLIGRWMHLPESEIADLIRSGLLHDLGKLKVDPSILNKPDKLTTAEFAKMQQHPIFSHEMLLQAGESNKKILQAVLQHHEKPNRTGYPYKLGADKISLYARITAVSDVYDAMVSKRCYKPANTPFTVLALFTSNRFSDLDGEIVNIFLKNIAFLFVGMQVKLSNGESGEVVFVSPSDYSNPVVKVGKRVFSTNETCKCISADKHF